MTRGRKGAITFADDLPAIVNALKKSDDALK